MAALPKIMATMMMAMMMIDEGSSSDKQRLAPISLRLSTEFLPDSWIHVNFYGETFLGFYQCLSSKKFLTCSGHLARDEKQPYAETDRRVVSIDKPELKASFDLSSNYFTCEYDVPKDKLSCRRMDFVSRACDTLWVVHFRIPLNDSSVSNCVGLIWHSSDEALLFDADIHGIKLCDNVCNTTSAHNSSHGNDDHDAPPQDEPPWRNDKSHWGSPRVSENLFYDKKAQIIIIVVASIVLTALLIVAVGIFRRKLLQMKVPPRTPTVEEKGDNKAPLNRKVSSSSRNFSIHIPEKASPVALSPPKLFSEI